VSAGLLLLALAAGCSSAPDRHPVQTQVVVLSTAHPAPPLSIGLVSAVRIVLPGPEAASGYIWEIASNNTRVLEQMGPLKPAGAAPGQPPTTTVSFYTLRPGRSALRFFLVVPGERDTVPLASCELTVRVRE
jgi:hypothetical protein